MFDVAATAAAAYSIAIEGDTFRFAAANDACLAMAGLTAGFYPGLTPHDCFPDPIADAITARYTACRDSRRALSYVCEVAAADGPRRWRTTLVPMIDASDRVTSLFGILASADAESDELTVATLPQGPLPLVMETIDGGFWVYDVATKMFEASASLATLLAGPGCRTLDLAGYLNHVHAEDLGAGLVFYPDTDRTTIEYRVVTFEGRTRWLESKRRIIRDGAGRAVKVVSLVVDVTERKTRLRTLEMEATIDALTSLKNRRAFERAAIQALREARAAKKRIALLLIDLDGFKPINDRFGHRVGDDILCKVARRLARHTGKTGTLGRIGGDEFAVLIDPGSAEAAVSIATRLARAFEKPFKVDGTDLAIGLSTGIAVSTPEDVSVSTLIERADRDLYATKQGGRRSA